MDNEFGEKLELRMLNRDKIIAIQLALDDAQRRRYMGIGPPGTETIAAAAASKSRFQRDFDAEMQAWHASRNSPDDSSQRSREVRSITQTLQSSSLVYGAESEQLRCRRNLGEMFAAAKRSMRELEAGQTTRAQAVSNAVNLYSEEGREFVLAVRNNDVATVRSTLAERPCLASLKDSVLW